MPERTANQSFDPQRYWEGRLSNQWTLGATGWLSLGESFNRWAYAVRAPVFRRLVRSELRDRPAQRVLDVGSGTGFYLRQWQRLGAQEVSGSDLTATAVERLRLAFPECHIQALDIGAPDLRLSAASFDAISAIDMLYHIVDDAAYQRAFCNLAGLLAPGGVLIFSESFVPVRHPGEHQVSRTAAEIHDVLAQAGLTIVQQRPVFVLMNTPSSSGSRLLHRWWDGLCRVVRRHEAAGWLAGAALAPIELGLTRVLRDGPSTMLIAARLTEPDATPQRAQATEGNR